MTVLGKPHSWLDVPCCAPLKASLLDKGPKDWQDEVMAVFLFSEDRQAYKHTMPTDQKIEAMGS